MTESIKNSQVPEGIRSSDRLTNPMFLGRITSSLAAVFLLDGEGLRLDCEGELRTAPLLLRRGEFCGPDSKTSRAESTCYSSYTRQSGGCEETKGYYGYPCRADFDYHGDLAGYHAATPSFANSAEDLRAGTTEFPGCPYDSPSQECVSYSRWTSFAKRFYGWLCSSSWTSTQNQTFPGGHRDSTSPSRCPSRRAPWPHFGNGSRGFPQACTRHDSCDHAAESSHDRPSCPSGESGFSFRSDCRFQQPGPVDERSFEERKAATAIGREERGLLPSGGSECYEEDKAHGSFTYQARGLSQEGHLLKVPRKAGRLCTVQGLRLGDMDVVPDRRRHDSPGFERSSGVVGSNTGDSRTSSPRRFKVGPCLHPFVAAGSTSNPVHFEVGSCKPTSQGICPSLPTTIGHDGIGLCERTRCHHQPKKRSSRTSQAKQADRRGQAGSESKEENEVPQKAKGRRKYRILGSHSPRIVSPQVAPGRPGEVAALGSEPVACKGSASQEPLPPTWETLQSFSFARWCSSLCRRVLRSRTAFGAFVSKTLQIPRWTGPPAKLLFPLPVPKPGVFVSLHPRVSSRHRRKHSLDQALHVVVMALNFLHSDFSFVSLEQISQVQHQKDLPWHTFR